MAKSFKDIVVSVRRFLPFVLVVATYKVHGVAGTGFYLNQTELKDTASLFSGPLEVVAEHPEFKWLESPLWSESGNFVLFTDVPWLDETTNTNCGMIWKWDMTTKTLSKFLPCSGLIGPPPSIPPANPDITDYVEAGANGIIWGWQGDQAKDLLLCQHGRHRIVRINLDDIKDDGTIHPDDVAVIVDSHDGKLLNSPNDLTLVDGTLYFTDPPFGLQYKSDAPEPIPAAFTHTNQDIGIYKIEGGDPGMTNLPREPVRIVNVGTPTDPWFAPNGIAVKKGSGDLFSPITDFTNPRLHYYTKKPNGRYELPPQQIDCEYRIRGEKSSFPTTNDGCVYSEEMDLYFASGPGGVYIVDGTTLDVAGFLRVDDLVGNVELGGGYLWIAANRRFLRIPLAESASSPHQDGGDTQHYVTLRSPAGGCLARKAKNSRDALYLKKCSSNDSRIQWRLDQQGRLRSRVDDSQCIQAARAPELMEGTENLEQYTQVYVKDCCCAKKEPFQMMAVPTLFGRQGTGATQGQIRLASRPDLCVSHFGADPVVGEAPIMMFECSTLRGDRAKGWIAENPQVHR